MEDSNFIKLEHNINSVLVLINDLMEQNKSLKKQLENALKDRTGKDVSGDGSDDNAKQLQINTVTGYLSKDKEEAIKKKVRNVLEKLREIKIEIL